MGGILKPPIFVMGCGHSGTTLVRELVGSHSRIYKTPDEIKLFRLPPEEREPVIESWNCECIVGGCHRWLDKMAAYVHDIDTILRRFPEASILFVLRDGRDVALSLRKRWDFERGVTRWIEDNRAAQPYLPQSNFYVVRYEDLVRAAEAQMRAIFGFLDEDYEDTIFEYWRQNREDLGIPDDLGKELHEGQDQSEFRLLRKWQISQPIYDGSGRWKRELSQAEKDHFKHKANDLLVEFGYAQDDRW